MPLDHNGHYRCELDRRQTAINVVRSRVGRWGVFTYDLSADGEVDGPRRFVAGWFAREAEAEAAARAIGERIDGERLAHRRKIEDAARRRRREQSGPAPRRGLEEKLRSARKYRYDDRPGRAARPVSCAS